MISVYTISVFKLFIQTCVVALQNLILYLCFVVWKLFIWMLLAYFIGEFLWCTRFCLFVGCFIVTWNLCFSIQKSVLNFCFCLEMILLDIVSGLHLGMFVAKCICLNLGVIWFAELYVELWHKWATCWCGWCWGRWCGARNWARNWFLDQYSNKFWCICSCSWKGLQIFIVEV